jgi:glycerol-3-phosphate dehydrogenase
MQSREDRIRKIKENPNPSVLIVGSGINGIGTFRDLALQGIDVVMVDRGDYCSGASAASSHMVHGGIRYLENGEFRLVKEAVEERNRLIVNAPHLVKPLKTTIPIFKLFSGLMNAPLKFLGLLDRPAERGAVVIKIGMTMYDFFTRKQKTVPRHVFRNREESLTLFPALNPEVRYTGTYYDAAMPSPERIAIELIRDAVRENDRAIPLNHVRLISAQGEMVTLRDEERGESIDLMPSILVNAAGPWIDLVNQSIGYPTKFIGGTKGSHLILDHPQLRQAIGENEFFFENKDGRIVLIFPLFDKVMIGTSDIRIDSPDNIVITEEEVDYFFEMIERVFPAIHVDRSHIVYTFSGVRPLQYSSAGMTGQISREHKVEIIEPGSELKIPVLSLVGGKWTSFRAFSEQVVDLVLDRLRIARKVSTNDLPIGGGHDYPIGTRERDAYFGKLIAAYSIDRDRLLQLFDVYGTSVGGLLQEYGLELSTMLQMIPEMSVAEIRHILLEEDVIHLDDLILRRTMLGKLGRITPESLQEISRICAEVLGWSAEKTSSEVDRFVDLLKRNHKMDFCSYIGE